MEFCSWDSILAKSRDLAAVSGYIDIRFAKDEPSLQYGRLSASFEDPASTTICW